MRFFDCDRRGMSLTEVMLTTALFVAISFAAVKIVMQMKTGFSTMEAKNTVKSSTQVTLNQIHRMVLPSVRIFDALTVDTYLTSAMLTGAPVPITGTSLPTIQESGTFDPTNVGFSTMTVGNSLFFAATNANMASVPVVNTMRSGGIYDVYATSYYFAYYYLARLPGLIHTTPKWGLVEWKSNNYIDYNELASIATPAISTQVVSGFFNQGYHYAWDRTKPVNSAFYLLNNAGGITPVVGHVLQAATWQILPVQKPGTATALNIGVSPNDPKLNIPLYTQPAGLFPGGFEVCIIGPEGGRQIRMRLVMIGSGAFQGTVADDEQVSTTVKDTW